MIVVLLDFIRWMHTIYGNYGNWEQKRSIRVLVCMFYLYISWYTQCHSSRSKGHKGYQKKGKRKGPVMMLVLLLRSVWDCRSWRSLLRPISIEVRHRPR